MEKSGSTTAQQTTNKLPQEFGRRAFGGDPAGYHAARPTYPEWVYETLTSRCGLQRGTAVFEIGAGTGIATHRLLSLGADPLVAVEPDARLADFLRTNNPDPALRVMVSPFDEADLGERSFDLGVCATAFHWFAEEPALAKIAKVLRPGGWWAAVWNEFADSWRPDPFHEATKKLLVGPASPGAGERGIPFSLDSHARLAALDRSGMFDVMERESREWPLVLDAEQAVALYATFSNVNARADRDSVLAELGRIAREDFDNRVTRNMTTSLYIARRKGQEENG
jgi:SAM-dependent methyltransferase